MVDHIVIAVDGSDEAKYAARRGLELAQRFDASADVLHVVEQKALTLTRTAGEKDKLRVRGEEILTEIEGLGSELGHPTTRQLREGNPAVQISEFANEQKASLVVIGRQGVTGVGRHLLGGVTEQVLHQSDIPVLVVPDGEHRNTEVTGYSRVLITTDGSENADVAIPYGVAIARNYGSVLYVLNVVDLQAAGGLFNAGGLEKEFVERLDAIGQEAVDRVANKIEETASDLEVKTAIERTASFEGISAGVRNYVKEHDIDLVVMGSHGRSNLKRQLLGSVASAVPRIVDVPVLIVKRSP